MCVYSMVLDQFGPLVPYPSPGPSPWAPPPTDPGILPVGPYVPWEPLKPTPAFPHGQLLTPEQLAQIIEVFKQAGEAAKQKLEARVAEMEKLLEELRAKSGPFGDEKAPKPKRSPKPKARKHGAGKKRRTGVRA